MLTLPFNNIEKEVDDNGYILQKDKLREIQQQVDIINAKIGFELFPVNIATIELILLIAAKERGAVIELLERNYEYEGYWNG